MRALIFVIVCALCLLLAGNSVLATSFEESVSQRQSVRSYSTADITNEELMGVLSDAYGYAGDHRVLPRIGSDYALSIYVINNTASYLYNPETSLLSLYDPSVNKITCSPHLWSWISDASAVLLIVWNETRISDLQLASFETGCLVQNIYLAAATRNLGACCVGGFDASIRYDLNLPTSLNPMIEMPLGYPTSAYPSATPDYSKMTGNLPLVQLGNSSLTDALNNINYSQTWSEESLSVQEISQLLWAAYGYSSTGHRTTPSAMNVYPMIVYVSNSTGVYQYIAENHSVTLVQSGDKRSEIATACGNQLWAASAPAVFLVALNSSYNEGNPVGEEESYAGIDSGCVAQQILLEGSAENLSSNFVANGLETLNGSGAQTLRSILNLTPDIVPLYIMPVGHPSPEIPESQSLLVIGLLLGCVASIIALSKLTRKRKREKKTA